MSMKIKTKYSFTNTMMRKVYFVTIRVESENGNPGMCFLNTESLFDKDTKFINIINLSDEKFLEDKGIKYIKETNSLTNETNIIPIGLVDIPDYKEYIFDELTLYSSDYKELYKLGSVIRNIEKAIKIKYEAVKFIKKCSDDLEICTKLED